MGWCHWISGGKNHVIPPKRISCSYMATLQQKKRGLLRSEGIFLKKAVCKECQKNHWKDTAFLFLFLCYFCTSENIGPKHQNNNKWVSGFSLVLLKDIPPHPHPPHQPRISYASFWRCTAAPNQSCGQQNLRPEWCGVMCTLPSPASAGRQSKDLQVLLGLWRLRALKVDYTFEWLSWWLLAWKDDDDDDLVLK